jgi:hypothetical protein
MGVEGGLIGVPSRVFSQEVVSPLSGSWDTYSSITNIDCLSSTS